jgi:hypothetical protein
MLRASLGKVVHTVQRAGTYAAKVPPQELHKIAVHVRAGHYTSQSPAPTPCVLTELELSEISLINWQTALAL